MKIKPSKTARIALASLITNSIFMAFLVKADRIGSRPEKGNSALSVDSFIDFLAQNKEWIFSGVGVLVLAAVGSFLRWAVAPTKEAPPEVPAHHEASKQPEVSGDNQPKQHKFCTQCGRVPEGYSYCLRGREHDFRTFSVDADSIHCTQCGGSPGSYSY